MWRPCDCCMLLPGGWSTLLSLGPACILSLCAGEGMTVVFEIGFLVFEAFFGCLRSGTDPKKQELKKGKPNVVMFVGLQVCMLNCSAECIENHGSIVFVLSHIIAYGSPMLDASVGGASASTACLHPVVNTFSDISVTGERQDDDLHEVRLLLQEEGLQAFPSAQLCLVPGPSTS